MKKEINATTGIAIAAVIFVALCVGLYFRFLHEPKLDPKVLQESQAGMSRTEERLRQAGIRPGGGPPNVAPGTTTAAPQR
ncbi:MAG: hypothetical protein SFU56_03055 [Capsulimonadales bacterium]|nr:hypothetical protein [Capsulimonadales bacterium]